MQEIGAIVKKHTYKNNKGEEKQMIINAIPNNIEKYMAFMLGNHLTFIDSFQFMSSSLDKLVSNLPRESLTLRAPRVLVPTPSTKRGVEKDPPPSISRTRNATNLKPLEGLGVSFKVSKNFKLV